MKAFVVTVAGIKPEQFSVEGQELKDDMKHFKVKCPTKISNWDMRVFKTSHEANDFYENYIDMMKNMKKYSVCTDRNLPSLLFKKRYIALTLLGIKFYTTRTGERLKNANEGDLINIYDQTHFHTVRLTKKEKINDKEFKYSFEKI